MYLETHNSAGTGVIQTAHGQDNRYPTSLSVTMLWSISKLGAGLLLHTGELNARCVQNPVDKPHFWEILGTLSEKEQNQGLVSAILTHSNQLWKKLHGHEEDTHSLRGK